MYYSKIDTVIRYLLCQCEGITPLALQKALYYIQGFYFAFYKIFLFPEDCQAWVYVPVYKNIYFSYRDYQFDPIEKTDAFDESVFSSGEKSLIGDYFNTVKTKYNMIRPGDMKGYAQDMFLCK